MNATDLQKLKELAQAATSGPWKRGPYGWVFTDIEPNGYAVACCESKSGYMRNSACNEEFIAAANPAAILELIALAERAVSPAESVQSVDFYDQKLLELLWRWAETHMKRGYTNDNQAEAHASLADFLNAAVTAQEKIAHAKGRRSALEELHPQWLKEKERADRAEAERSMLAGAIADATKKAGIYNGEVSLTGPHLLMLADDLAEQALAARQAPDLSKLTRWSPLTNGMCAEPSGRYWLVADVQALLAQPLRPASRRQSQWRGLTRWLS